LPSISGGIGTPKYFSTVGAISMKSNATAALGRLLDSSAAFFLCSPE
jgi:hypothetical protein